MMRVFNVLYLHSIRKIMKLGIASAFVSNEPKKLSLVFVADPEAGKTCVLTDFVFRKPNGVYIFTDLTKSKIEKFLKDMKNNPEQVKYIIVPDFTRIFGHGQGTRRGIITLLNSGIEEGVREITTYIGGNAETTMFNKPVMFGLATSMTRHYFSDGNRLKFWKTTGFATRYLPVTFSYTSEQRSVIMRHISEGRDLFEKPEMLSLKPTAITCEAKFILQFEDEIKMLAHKMELYGFRYMKQFRVMLKAHALLRGAKKVEQMDVDEVRKLLRYVNLDYNVVEEDNGKVCGSGGHSSS